ncbi:MAG: thioesterase family protein [Gemmatimonadaceae bacterium]
MSDPTNTSERRLDIELRVRYGETDQMGVVYHAEYLVWCEMGRTEFIRSLGLPYAEMERRGTMLAVADASLRYHAPARYDDRIRVETTLKSAGSRAITFDYVIFNADTGVKLVTARTMLVALDRQGRAASIPSDIRELLQSGPFTAR